MAKELVTTIKSCYSFKPVEIPYNEKTSYAEGDEVIFKDEDGKEEFGVIQLNKIPSKAPENIVRDSKILRLATANDSQRLISYKEQSEHALSVCKKLIKTHKLDMQVFVASYSFDGSRVLFMFTADERVDFRDLVKDLAKNLQKQIYLRQIGPRDKAKIVGGYGKCGRSLCCSTFLDKLESISMDMVRVQSLESKGSSKLSGTCGKLLCCLKYEVDAYKELKKNIPDIGSKVKLKRGAPTPSKSGEIIALDILNQKVKLFFEDIEDYAVVDSDQIDKVLKSPYKSKKKDS
ncbi:hypothetical protein GF354_03630 [Candidatus Peregrinibacteria bacterium]|nr:hypothetical protein [Candidatus Peregrinibacteria bacterium]